MPLERRTLAIFLKAELGFFGVMVVTLTQTPRLKPAPLGFSFFVRLKVLETKRKAGVFGFFFWVFLGLLISWLIVGINKQDKKLSKISKIGIKQDKQDKDLA
jgi:TRAP-type C4-dicarboxylate transport system permease large subunit